MILCLSQNILHSQKWMAREAITVIKQKFDNINFKNEGTHYPNGNRCLNTQENYLTLRMCFADRTTVSLEQRSHRWGRCLVPLATCKIVLISD